MLVFVSGCASATKTIIGKVRPSIPVESVKFYDSVPAGAEIIAGLYGSANNVRPTSSINAMRKEAAKIGANGLVIEQAHAGMFVGASVSGKAIFVPEAN